MNLTLDFGQLLTIVAMLGSVSVLLIKLGAKDEQFKSLLDSVKELAAKQTSHAIEFGQLQNIVNGMLQMQKVSDQDREKIRIEVEAIFRRLDVLESRKHRGVTET